MRRKSEFFSPYTLEHRNTVSNVPKYLYKQERDWTCSLACIRSILSSITDNVPKEDELINKLDLKPGPYYSKDIRKLGLLNTYTTVYGCSDKDADFDKLLSYMEQGYYVMIETMFNYAHWFVLLSYFPGEKGDPEKSRVVVYDPYYDTTRLLITDEVVSMWVDGDHAETKVEKDFIAIRRE